MEAKTDMIKTEKLMKGAVDMHVHTSPDLFPRLMSDMEIARAAHEAGMSGVVIKNHFTTTADRAQIASEITGFPVFGGLVLNTPVGGLNPDAVRASLQLGAKMIWMPTIYAECQLKGNPHVPMFGQIIKPGTKGISLLNSHQKLKEEIMTIIELTLEYSAVLATGHISKLETAILVEQAAKMGHKKIMLTHPLSPMLDYSIEEIKELIDRGVTFVELNILDTTNVVNNPISTKTIARAIKEVGPRNAVMATDGGQTINPNPVKMLRQYINIMLDHGISEENIKTMVRYNPEFLLDI